MKKKIACLFIATSVFVFNACRKSDRDDDTETQSASDNAFADAIWNDVYKQLDNTASITSDVNRNLSINPAACYTVTVTPALPDTTFPKTLTIDFGATNCSGADGINRRGKVIAVFSGKYRDSLTTITISPNNYFVNDNQIEGTKIIFNKGHISGVMTYNITISNASITRTDGKIISWNSQRTRRWIAGESTLGVVNDDVYEITGNASGTGINGNSFTVSTTTPLRAEMSCRWIVSGGLKLSPANLDDRNINFGNGACDDKATVTINGNSYEIVLN